MTWAFEFVYYIVVNGYMLFFKGENRKMSQE